MVAFFVVEFLRAELRRQLHSANEDLKLNFLVAWTSPRQKLLTLRACCCRSGEFASLYNMAVHRPFRCSWNFGVLSATPCRFSGTKKEMDGLVFCELVVLDLPRLGVP